MLALQPREGEVRGVRGHAGEPAPPLIVEIVHELRVGAEALGRGHFAVVVLGPDAVLVAEGREPRTRRRGRRL